MNDQRGSRMCREFELMTPSGLPVKICQHWIFGDEESEFYGSGIREFIPQNDNSPWTWSP